MLEVGFEVGLLFWFCCWFGEVFSFGDHVLSVCGLCWFVILICSLLIGGIVCLAVRLMRSSVVLCCYLVWVLM